MSSLYYDFESGEAHFETPRGTIHGEITGKRQYKIQGGRLEHMFDSALNIGDEVLQRELSESADDKMRNIVATIQREQHAVIRNETAPVLILQGVAGSGKTSIALHRVAFLLYRFKDTLSSDNVMILSPNKVFGDYIADVLPELGEEQIAEIDFDRIAGKFLAKVTDYETFSEQVVKLLDHVANTAVHLLKQDVLDRVASGRLPIPPAYAGRSARCSLQGRVRCVQAFYTDPARRGLFTPLGRKKIEYADVFPLIYTMIRTARPENYGHIRHLLVDEMQDYTPIQYAVVRELFSCKMTILGDANQSVNPFSSSASSARPSLRRQRSLTPCPRPVSS